jgi:hypothetical protein
MNFQPSEYTNEIWCPTVDETDTSWFAMLGKTQRRAKDTGGANKIIHPRCVLGKHQPPLD